MHFIRWLIHWWFSVELYRVEYLEEKNIKQEIIHTQSTSTKQGVHYINTTMKNVEKENKKRINSHLLVNVNTQINVSENNFNHDKLNKFCESKCVTVVSIFSQLLV